MEKKPTSNKAKLDSILGKVERKAPAVRAQHNTCQRIYCVP